MKVVKTLLICTLISLTLSASNLRKHHQEEEEEHNENSHRRHKGKNVVIINKHYHINQPSSALIATHPNINALRTTQALIHNDLHNGLHYDLHRDIPHTHYIPQVHWVDDTLHSHTDVIDHGDHVHTLTSSHAHPAVSVSGLISNVAPTTTHLISPSIIPSVAHHVDVHHLDHYNHYDLHHDHVHVQSPATYHFSNSQEAALVYDNIVAPNPAHYHTPLNTTDKCYPQEEK